MSTITASRFVVGKKIQTPAGNSRVHYLQRLMLFSIAKTNAIYNARSFRTEEEARQVLQILNDRYYGKWVLQEVTKNPDSRRFEVLKEVE